MKIALIGYGKMGRTIEQILLSKYPEDEIVLKIGLDNLHELTIENLQKADVAIEFTQPDSAVNNILLCFDANVPVVVGTTAWLEHLATVSEVCKQKNGALFYAPNFSIGVNIFFEINKKLATIMQQHPQYNLSMIEIHHTEKKDAPSGTAIKTAEVILDSYTLKNSWSLDTDMKNEKELLITAKREPEVPGTHTVIYESDVDEISLTHQAKNRHGFAQGAIIAAKWIADKKGVYDMSDLLKF